MSHAPSTYAAHHRSVRRTAVVASLVLGLLALPLASPAFAKNEPRPVAPSASSTLQGGVARGLSAPLGSFAPVPGRPADKPIGVTFESLSRAGGTPIKIDGQDVANTTDGANFSIAVIDRGTRAVVESGTVNRASTSVLGALAEKYSGRNDRLMVVSSFRGIGADAGNTAAFKQAVKALGGRDLTEAELTLLKNGAAFSVVGVPGGAVGGAYINVDPGTGGGTHGNVSGYLRVNVATDLYGVVNTESPTFDTTNYSRTPTVSTVVFNHNTFKGALVPEESGFLVLAFDDGLNLVYQRSITTNGPGEDSYFQSFANDLFTNAINSGSRNTIVVRSIGHPTPAGPGWNDIAKTIEKLGGNRLAFNNLGADSDYSLVGSAVAGVPAIESSAVLGNNGPISGSLARNRDMVFTPVVGGSDAGVNTELIDIATQASTDFPAFTEGAPGTTAAGTAAADAYIGRTLRLCASVGEQPRCSVRTEFYANFLADFHQAATDLQALVYPGNDHGFSNADFTAVRARLVAELSMVNQVRTYFTGLQKPFGEAAQAGTIDITRLTDAVVDSIPVPKANPTASYGLALLGKIASLGSFVPAAKAVSSGVSAAFALGSFLAQPAGPPQLASTVRTSAGELGATVRAQMLATSRSLNGVAMLVVSDYGRLVAVSERLPSTRWRLPNDTGPALAMMSVAVQQSAAEKLVPLVYPWLLRGTPGERAQSMSCKYYDGLIGENVYYQYWEKQPARAALVAARDYTVPGARSLAPGRAIPAPYWFAKPGVGFGLTPPDALATMLFAPQNAERGTLGINLYSFLSPRVFGVIHQANHGATGCDL